MEEIKVRLTSFVTDKLSAAPEGAAKADLIEELSENLYQRWTDMTAAGMDSEEAYQKAADELGDTAELVDYLKSLQPDEPLPEPSGDWEDMMNNISIIVKGAINQAKDAIKEVRFQLGKDDTFRWESDDGSVKVHVGPSDEWISELEEKLSGLEEKMSEKEDEISEREDEISEAEEELSQLEEELSELADKLEGSDAHIAAVEKRIAAKGRRISAKQAELDALNEELEQLREEYAALEQEHDETEEELARQEEAEDAEDENKDADGQRHVDINNGDGAKVVFQAVEKAMDTASEKINEAARKMEEAFKNKPFTIGVDVDNNGVKMGVNPHAPSEKDVIYGVGYDKEKGGFFAQWGEYKGGYNRPVEGPVASEALKGIEVQTVSGDVTIRMTEEADADVVIDGDVEELDVRRSDDGVLTITQGKTASSSFFFGRGLSHADVILYLPRRPWDFLKVSTISGDIHIDGDNEVDQLLVKTTSGDLKGGLPRCRQMDFKSISGDLSWRGDVQRLQTGTTSGDITVDGNLGEVLTSSISGDVRMQGAILRLKSGTTSGDITVRTNVLPEELVTSSRSGDCTAYIPDRPSFSVHFRTGSGAFRSDFFNGSVQTRESTLDYGEGGPTYHLTTGSGDLRVKKL